jgi:hypothetical protein
VQTIPGTELDEMAMPDTDPIEDPQEHPVLTGL